MRIVLITDAWYPQVNGVVTTWNHVRDQCEQMGHTFEVIHPGLFRTFQAPRYPDIRLAVLPRFKLRRMLDEMAPEAVHIATEGPLGIAARGWCRSRRMPWTTSYHTQFPDYLRTYFKIPRPPTYAFLRWFHGRAERTLVPTRSIKEELIEHGFKADQLVVWTRGVDHATFHPQPDDRETLAELPRPRFVYVGRVAAEKNIKAFLDLDLEGVKVVIGDGPAKADLERRYADVRFVGWKKGEDLARHIAACDVFVFPSKTDTFGVVMIEALACGLPVAAYPVTGPRDVITDPKVGALDEDLQRAAERAAELNAEDCIAFAESFTWRRCADMVVENLATRTT
jgi:glycosyltransferase involved in cell wall biosynthesis